MWDSYQPQSCKIDFFSGYLRPKPYTKGLEMVNLSVHYRCQRLVHKELKATFRRSNFFEEKGLLDIPPPNYVDEKTFLENNPKTSNNY